MIQIWAFLTSTAGKVILAVLAFIAFTYFVYQEGKDNGASQLQDEINRADKKVIEDSRAARDTVDRCRAASGVWNRTTGKCE